MLSEKNHTDLLHLGSFVSLPCLLNQSHGTLSGIIVICDGQRIIAATPAFSRVNGDFGIYDSWSGEFIGTGWEGSFACT